MDNSPGCDSSVRIPVVETIFEVTSMLFRGLFQQGTEKGVPPKDPLHMCIDTITMHFGV